MNYAEHGSRADKPWVWLFKSQTLSDSVPLEFSFRDGTRR